MLKVAVKIMFPLNWKAEAWIKIVETSQCFGENNTSKAADHPGLFRSMLGYNFDLELKTAERREGTWILHILLQWRVQSYRTGSEGSAQVSPITQLIDSSGNILSSPWTFTVLKMLHVLYNALSGKLWHIFQEIATKIYFPSSQWWRYYLFNNLCWK